MNNGKDYMTMWANAKHNLGGSEMRSENRRVHELQDDCEVIVEQLNLDTFDANFEFLWDKHS